MYHEKNYKMKFYSFFDGKTQFSQIFLGRILFFLMGGGVGWVGGQITASFTCESNNRLFFCFVFFLHIGNLFSHIVCIIPVPR